MDGEEGFSHPILVNSMAHSLTPAQREFYVEGFLAVLRRHRRATITGWICVAAGALSIPLGWSAGTTREILDLLVSCVTVAAGIVLVEQSVGMLESYVRVPFHAASAAEIQGEGPPESPEPVLVAGLRRIMEDVDRGGWQEAFGAIAAIEKLSADSEAEITHQ
jgi:hypothetical protein